MQTKFCPASKRYLVEEREGVDLLDDVSQRGKHSNATVLQLSLAKDAEIENLGEAERIEASVTRERAIEISRLLKEGNRLRERAREHSHARRRDRCWEKTIRLLRRQFCTNIRKSKRKFGLNFIRSQ